MKFSLIIPIYKVEKYLRECIDSILNQTYKDFEVILIDDGSPDNCPMICDDYSKKDNRITVIHQQNAGLACARNSGISIAQGEYIICIDSDDYIIDKDFLQKISSKLETSSDIILYGYQKYFESNGIFGEKSVPILSQNMSTNEMLKTVLATDTYCGTAWTKAVKRSILKDNNIQFRAGMISEDIDWYLNVLCHAKTFESINEVGIIYRQRDGSISHNPKLNSLTDNLWILETWPDRILQNVNDNDIKTSLLNVMAYYYANDLILFSGYKKSQSAPFKTRLKKASYLLKYAVTPRSLIIKRFYKILGFEITVMLLKILSIIKTRK